MKWTAKNQKEWDFYLGRGRGKKSIYTEAIQKAFNIIPNWHKTVVNYKRYCCFVCESYSSDNASHLYRHMNCCLKHHGFYGWKKEDIRMAVYRYNYGIDFTYEMLYRLYVVEKFGSREIERIFGGVHHRVIEYMQWYYKIQPKRQYDGKIEATIKQGKTKQLISILYPNYYKIKKEISDKLKKTDIQKELTKKYNRMYNQKKRPLKIQTKISSFLPDDAYYLERIQNAIDNYSGSKEG